MKIPFTKFIQLLCENKSAKVSLRTVKVTGGSYIPTLSDLEFDVKNAENLSFRVVSHRQTNAICFEGESWLWFRKPNHVKRQCYSLTLGEREYLLMVDHREPYINDFGTPISEISTVLTYQIGA